MIAGDLIPSGKNISLYQNGEAEKLFDSKVVTLFQNADFSVVNLEGALTDASTKQCKIGPNIKAPTATIHGIKNLGVKAVALANNHITDYGSEGYVDTISTLERNGIDYFGAGLNRSDVSTHISIKLDGGKRVCLYNVSETFFNIPDDKTAGVNVYDEWSVTREIQKLKASHDYLIVIYHGGAENFRYPTPQTRMRFHRMAESGADLITAQHTHCIGCEEVYGKSYLLYGQGNFSFARMNKRMNREGIVLEIVFDDTISIKKHRIEMLDNDCLVYSENQDWGDLTERSDKINDEAFIIEEYKKLKPFNISERYLWAYGGRSANLFRKIFPKRIWRKWVQGYSPAQIMRNEFTLTSDRAREDVFYIWESLSNRKSP